MTLATGVSTRSLALAAQPAGVLEALAFLADRPLVVLTGAGCSTGSTPNPA